MPVLTKATEPLALMLSDDGSIPNDALLPMAYRGAVDLSCTPDPEDVIEADLRRRSELCSPLW